MLKVTFDYPPEVARKKLSSTFSNSPGMISHINDMCDSQATVFAALCDGKSVTNAGNRIESDYEVTKLASVIDVLENQFFLPISRQKIHTESDTGATALQARYMIAAEDLNELVEQPEDVISRREREAFIKLMQRDNRCLKRLINVHGYEEVFQILQSMAPANDDVKHRCG
jgi:hypothetical protein